MFNFRIYNWMSKSLNLKKFTLLIYAYVYSFTNRENGYFECTIENYIEKFRYIKKFCWYCLEIFYQTIIF